MGRETRKTMFELFIDVDYWGIQRSKETPVGMLQNKEVELSWKIEFCCCFEGC